MMKNMKLPVVFVLSITLLLANAFTSIAQTDTEKQKIANEFSDKGRAAAKKGNYREAIEHYTVAIALTPHGFGPYDERGDAKLETKDYKGAIADYDTYIQKCTALRDGQSQKSSYEQSVTSTAINYAPNSKGRVALARICEIILPSVYNKRGVAKDRLGDKHGACKDFREACKLGENIACKNSEGVCSNEVSSDTKNNLPSSSQPQGSSYAGRYKGEWTAKPAPLASFKSGEEEHTGTWDITINSDGGITGTEVDETSGEEGNLNGFINERGFITLSVKYKTTSKMKGKLEKQGIRLVGKAQQWCGTDDDDLPCLKIDIVLKRQ